MSFINKFRNFMYGRYGIDELYGFLLKLYIILVIIGLFVYSKFFVFNPKIDIKKPEVQKRRVFLIKRKG